MQSLEKCETLVASKFEAESRRRTENFWGVEFSKRETVRSLPFLNRFLGNRISNVFAVGEQVEEGKKEFRLAREDRGETKRNWNEFNLHIFRMHKQLGQATRNGILYFQQR